MLRQYLSRPSLPFSKRVTLTPFLHEAVGALGSANKGDSARNSKLSVYVAIAALGSVAWHMKRKDVSVISETDLRKLCPGSLEALDLGLLNPLTVAGGMVEKRLRFINPSMMNFLAALHVVVNGLDLKRMIDGAQSCEKWREVFSFAIPMLSSKDSELVLSLLFRTLKLTSDEPVVASALLAMHMQGLDDLDRTYRMTTLPIVDLIMTTSLMEWSTAVSFAKRGLLRSLVIQGDTSRFA